MGKKYETAKKGDMGKVGLGFLSAFISIAAIGKTIKSFVDAVSLDNRIKYINDEINDLRSEPMGAIINRDKIKELKKQRDELKSQQKFIKKEQKKLRKTAKTKIY